MKEVKYSIEEIKKFLEQFVATKSPKSDSWYVEEDVMYRVCIGSFIEYIQQDDAEREQRRKLYEELKKEFEG